jgi:hypothetical protein
MADIYKGPARPPVGKPVSRQNAQRIARETLERAERERQSGAIASPSYRIFDRAKREWERYQHRQPPTFWRLWWRLRFWSTFRGWPEQVWQHQGDTHVMCDRITFRHVRICTQYDDRGQWEIKLPDGAWVMVDSLRDLYIHYEHFITEE